MKTLAPDQDPDALAEAYSKAYVAAATQHERLFDGMTELFFASLSRRSRHRKKSKRCRARPKTVWALRPIRIILGGNSVPNPKPHPDMLDKIMAATGTQDLVMVGDTTYDLEMAKAAGVKAIGVSWGHHSVERLNEWAPVVHSVDELQRALGV